MSLRFDPKEGLIVVPTRLSGPDGDVVAQLALDTGATESVVNRALLMLLGYDPAVVLDRIQMTTGSGLNLSLRL